MLTVFFLLSFLSIFIADGGGGGDWGFTAPPTLVCVIWAPEEKPGIGVAPCSFR